MITETSTRVVEPDITVVSIAGRLSLGNTLGSLEASIKRLAEEGSRRVVIDLTGLNFIDSAGIGMLIGCTGQMEQCGGRFRIAGAHGTVARAFDIVHMNRIAALDPDVESACRNIAAASE